MRCVTGKHLRTIIWIVQFKLPFGMLIYVHPGQNTAIEIICNSNDHSNFTLYSRVKTLLVWSDQAIIMMTYTLFEPGCRSGM